MRDKRFLLNEYKHDMMTIFLILCKTFFTIDFIKIIIT